MTNQIRIKNQEITTIDDKLHVKISYEHQDIVYHLKIEHIINRDDLKKSIIIEVNEII